MKMADDLLENLTSYKVQLLQVDTALSADNENEDLLKLKSDLLEVITLTEQLLGGGSSLKELTSEEEVGAWFRSDWHSGEKCMAPWSKDKQYYPATIEEILEDGTCTIIFDKYSSTELIEMTSLRPYSEEEGRKALLRTKSKKDKTLAQREYKKNKVQKKAQKQKEIEDNHELDKNKWLQFNAKVFSKTAKGKVKRSIFATPDLTEGKVGVGTCGVSGRPMTKFAYHVEKYAKKS